MSEPVKTSAEWSREIQDFCGVLDPDGWDRRSGKFQYSWNEPITKGEILERLCNSTIRANIDRLIEWEQQ